MEATRTDNNLAPHKTTQRMQCHLYDCFTDIHSAIDISNPKYLLRYHQSKLAEISIFNAEFTSIAKTFKLPQLANIKCFHFWVNQSSAQRNFIAYDGHKITVYSVKTEQQVYLIEQKCQSNVKLEANDELVYLSMPVQKDETEYAISYSKKDQFYLIKIQTRLRVNKIQIIKLTDADRKTGFFSWFSKPKIQHYTDIQIHPFISDRVENGFQFVSIRDNKIVLHKVELNRELDKSMIKVISQVKDSKTMLDVGAGRLAQTIFTPNDQYQVKYAEILTAYEKNGIIILIQINLHLQQTIDIQVSKIFDNIPSKYFQMIKSEQNLFFVLTDKQSNTFQVLRHQVKDNSNVKKQSIQQTERIYTSREKIHLSIGLKHLFLISVTNIQKITLAQDFAPENQTTQYELRKTELERFQKKIHKCVNIGDMEQLSNQLQQKQAYLLEWLQPQQEAEQIEQIRIQNTQNIICTHIAHEIVMSQQYSQLIDLLKQLSEYDPEKEEALQNAIRQCQKYSMKRLLGYIVEVEMYPLFIEGILEGLFNHPMKQSSIELIQQLCEQPAKKCLNILRRQQKHNPTLFKLLINYSVYFMKLDEEIFQYLFDIKQETKLVKDLILNYKLQNQFINYFVSSKIVFTEEEFKQLVQHLYNHQDGFEQFVRKLMFEIKQIESNNPDFILENAEIIVKGFKDCSQAVIQIFEQTYPGLMFFFYLNSNARKEGAEDIQKMAKECSKEDSYIMLLPIASELKDGNSILEDALRCRKQQIHAKSQKQLTEELNNNKIQKIQSQEKEQKPQRINSNSIDGCLQKDIKDNRDNSSSD